MYIYIYIYIYVQASAQPFNEHLRVWSIVRLQALATGVLSIPYPIDAHLVPSPKAEEGGR